MFKIVHGKGVFYFVFSIFLLLIVETLVSAAGADGKIIFSHKGALWTMNADGTNQHALGIEGVQPSWSPDGRQVVFTVFHRGDKAQGKNPFTETFIINADGSGQRLLISTQHLQETEDGLPVWSPDGSRIAFFSNRPGRDDIFVIDVSGENLTNLTQSPEIHERVPSWSPDGTHILYSSWDGHFHTLRLADGYKRQVTQDEGDRRNSAWSPDGKHIVFQSEREEGKLDLYRITVDSREVFRLTRLHEANGFSPDWCCIGVKPASVSPRHHKLTKWGKLKANQSFQ